MNDPAGQEHGIGLFPGVGQCSEITRTKVEAKEKYTETRRELDMLSLLTFTKEISYCYEGHKHVAHRLYEAQCRFFTLYQGKDATDQDYLERFNTTVAMLNQIGAARIGNDGTLTEAILKNHADGSNVDMIIKAEEESKEGYYAMAFLRGADRERYGKLLEDLDNDYVKGKNSHLKTVSGAYSLLTNYRQYKMYTLNGGGDGMEFASMGVREAQGQGRQE